MASWRAWGRFALGLVGLGGLALCDAILGSGLDWEAGPAGASGWSPCAEGPLAAWEPAAVGALTAHGLGYRWLGPLP